MTKKLVSIGFLLFLSACAGTPKSTPEYTPESSPPPSRPSKTVEEENVDYPALKRSLGLERAETSLGITEKPFNTCEAGYGYSSSHNCRRLYFTVIHIQLLCRDSEGTVSTGIDRASQTPIAYKPVVWMLKGNGGQSKTDGDGYAQIQSVSANSQRQQRLKVSVGNDFLYMRANEITKVVTPKSWCE